MNDKHKRVVKEWIESIVVAFICAILIRTYFVQPFKIPSGSMRMTLIEGDHLFVNKVRFGPLVLPEIHSPDFLKNVVDIRWPQVIMPLTKMRIPGYSKPQRGDVIVFVYPQDRRLDFIKRLIALPGDVVEIRDGQIFINGKWFNDPRIRGIYYYNHGTYGTNGQPLKVPEGKYYVLGDNSGSSNDSRFWGFVDEKDVIGRAELIFWPPSRIRVIR